MTVWTAARQHKMLIGVSVVVGMLLASATVFSIGLKGNDLKLTSRPLGNYVTSLNAVIDTSGFGLGSSETDIIKLAYLAPTYAELLTSEPVLRKAAAALPKGTVIRRTDAELGKEVDAIVHAEPVGQSPVLKLTVEARTGALATKTAAAIMAAFKDYLVSSQDDNKTLPKDRLAIIVMGEPTAPKLASNRQREFAVLLFCLPIALALLIAYRIESSKARSVSGPDAQPAQQVDDVVDTANAEDSCLPEGG